MRSMSSPMNKGSYPHTNVFIVLPWWALPAWPSGLLNRFNKSLTMHNSTRHASLTSSSHLGQSQLSSQCSSSSRVVSNQTVGERKESKNRYHSGTTEPSQNIVWLKFFFWQVCLVKAEQRNSTVVVHTIVTEPFSKSFFFSGPSVRFCYKRTLEVNAQALYSWYYTFQHYF